MGTYAVVCHTVANLYHGCAWVAKTSAVICGVAIPSSFYEEAVKW